MNDHLLGYHKAIYLMYYNYTLVFYNILVYIIDEQPKAHDPTPLLSLCYI